MCILVCLEDFPVAGQTEVTDGGKLLQGCVLITDDETTLHQHGKLSCDVCWLLVISHTLINDEVPPWYALLGGVAGTVDAKVQLFLKFAKKNNAKNKTTRLFKHYEEAWRVLVNAKIALPFNIAKCSNGKNYNAESTLQNKFAFR